MQPVLNITERLQHIGLADNTAAAVKHYPTVRDVKNSVRVSLPSASSDFEIQLSELYLAHLQNLIKHLVLSMDTFHALPRALRFSLS